MATTILARWAVSLSAESLPAHVKHAASRSLYNYLGCAIGGATHPTVKKATLALMPFFAAERSATLFGHREREQPSTGVQNNRADASHAALLNGIASHVHDYDDTHLATIIHPTGPVASAALAYAEHLHSLGDRRAISGQDLLTAIVAGIEASCKLGLAVWPAHYDIGWHITSTTGSVGAAIAVGKLMRLDESQLVHAIGLAAVQVTGLREMFGSDTKSFHPGRAAQNGLMAALLAQQGFTSSEAGLEANRGWANVVAGGGTPELEKYFAELGQTWEILRNAFKPFPCGIVCHPAIDAAIQIHQGLSSDEREALTDAPRGCEDGKDEHSVIRSVSIGVHPLVLELTGKRAPRDGLEGKFSVYHGVAVGLLFGQAGPAQYADAAVRDPAVVRLRDRVSADEAPNISPDEVYMAVELADGRTIDKHIRHAVGSLEVPMSDAQLMEKFLDQAGLVVGPAVAKRASELAWKVPEMDDAVSQGLRLL